VALKFDVPKLKCKHSGFYPHVDNKLHATLTTVHCLQTVKPVASGLKDGARRSLSAPPLDN